MTIDRVVDGDTVDGTVDLGFDVHVKQRFRLLGIDAPETRTKDLVEKASGLKSKEWLEDKAESANEVTVITNKTGKYGRYLATLIIDGVDINQEMLNNGLAKVYGK